MTFDELKVLFPNATLKTWHKHKNGKGWVENTASVSNTAWVGPDALVCGKARVSGNAWVFDNARVFDNAQVYGTACVYGDARVSGHAEVYNDARVFGKARVSGNARVSAGKWTVSPLSIKGTKHSLCICAPGVIKIGCEEHSIEHWLKNYKSIGKESEYSSEEIKEYGQFIKFISSIKKQPSICGAKEINERRAG